MSRRSVFLFPLLTLLLLLAGLALMGNITPKTAQASSHADLRILKYSSPTNEVRAGEQFTYTIIVDNLGPMTATNVVITDTLVTSAPVDANGCSIAVRTDGGAIDEFNCNFALSSGVFDLGTMGSNQLNPRSPTDMGRIIVTINATANQATDLTAIATVTSDSPDPNMDNNVAVDTLSVTNTADLRIIKIANPSNQVRAGEQFTYTIIVDNLGPGVANNIVITDTLVTSAPVDPNGCSIAVRTDGGAIDEFNCNFALSSGVFDLATMGSNHLNPRSPTDMGRIIITINATADQATDMTNVTTVTAATLDPNLDNNLAITTLSVTDVADLALQKTAVGQVQAHGSPAGTFTQQAGRVTAGATVTYTLVVTNEGPSHAENVLLEDYLPDGLGVQQVTASQGSCAVGPTLTCGLGTLPASGSATVMVIARSVSSLTSGAVLNNGAIVSSDVLDANNGNNMDTSPVIVATAADLWVTVDQSPDKILHGKITYTIMAGNDGPSDEPYALIEDALPEEVVSATWECVPLSGASCRQDGIGDVLAPADLPAGSRVIIIVEGTLSGPPLLNTVTIDSTLGDSDPYAANDQATVNNPLSTLYLSVLFNPGSAPDVFPEAQEAWKSAAMGR